MENRDRLDYYCNFNINIFQLNLIVILQYVAIFRNYHKQIQNKQLICINFKGICEYNFRNRFFLIIIISFFLLYY